MPCKGFSICAENGKCQVLPADNKCLKIIYQKYPIKDLGRRSTYYFDPMGNKVLLFNVDGHVISQKLDGDASKCDFLLVLKKDDAKNTLIFVELKGQDIDKALKQISNAVDLLKVYFPQSKFRYVARIVPTKVPKIFKPSSLSSIKSKFITLNGNKKSNVEDVLLKGIRMEEKFSDFY